MIKVKSQFIPSEPFTFMVSGGLDSICAAHWLKFSYRKPFSLLHFNHDVQPINFDMAGSVWKFALDFDFGGRFIERDLDVTPVFTDTSEKGLRDWRLYMLQGLGGKYVTAHHLNDCVENYLSNTFKGCPEHKPIPWFTQATGFSIYHPFLTTTKQDFIDYANENNLMKYVIEDPTNHDSSNNRSWLRTKILPELNERNLGLEKVVMKKFYL